MEENQKIPMRSQVKKEDTWAIEDMYATVEDWEKDFAAAKKVAEEAAEYAGRLGESAQALYDWSVLTEKLDCMLSEIYGYASRVKDQDTADAAGQTLSARAMGLYVECSGLISFADPEILSIPEEKLEAFYAEKPELLKYRRSINEVRRCKDHILSPELEKILADAGEMAQAPGTVYSSLVNADLTFDPIKGSNEEELEVTGGSFIPLMQSPDRNVRKAAFESLYGGYGKVLNTAAGLLNAQVSQLKFFAKARKYPDALHASLDATNVPVEVYHNLIEAVHEDIGILHRYMRLRKKLMKTDELHMYDLYTPIISDADKEIPYEKAKEIIIEALQPLGEDYIKVLTEGFNNRWIDVYENEGKRGGAYSAGGDPHPYVLLNQKDTLDSMFTIAHEMGHSLHTYYSMKNQPTAYANYVIFVAEVASTCNEVLLVKHLLANTTDKKERAYLINHFLEQFRGTVYRQTMFAEFELWMNEHAEKGETLTADMMCDAYYELNKKYFGDGMTVDRLISVEWARIPHFFYNFYVFQYATGFSAAVAIANRILTEGKPAVEDYIKFLSAGSSMDPISVLKIAGVDMTTAQPVNDALKLFNELIDEMAALAE